MTILGWLLMGAAAGIAAKLVLPGQDPNHVFVTPIVGVMGAVIGGVAGRGAGGAALGAAALVVVYAVTTGRPVAEPHHRRRLADPRG